MLFNSWSLEVEDDTKERKADGKVFIKTEAIIASEHTTHEGGMTLIFVKEKKMEMQIASEVAS